MSVAQIQYALAAVFFVLGGWCLVAPGSVVDLAVTPAYRSDAVLVNFAMGCFGAQAILSGLFAAFSRFTATTFLAYGIALLPFFWFDYYFYVEVPILNEVGMLDAVGNVIMLALCVMGWRKARAEGA